MNMMKLNTNACLVTVNDLDVIFEFRIFSCLHILLYIYISLAQNMSFFWDIKRSQTDQIIRQRQKFLKTFILDYMDTGYRIR